MLEIEILEPLRTNVQHPVAEQAPLGIVNTIHLAGHPTRSTMNGVIEELLGNYVVHDGLPVVGGLPVVLE